MFYVCSHFDSIGTRSHMHSTTAIAFTVDMGTKHRHRARIIYNYKTATTVTTHRIKFYTSNNSTVNTSNIRTYHYPGDRSSLNTRHSTTVITAESDKHNINKPTVDTGTYRSYGDNSTHDSSYKFTVPTVTADQYGINKSSVNIEANNNYEDSSVHGYSGAATVTTNAVRISMGRYHKSYNSSVPAVKDMTTATVAKEAGITTNKDSAYASDSRTHLSYDDSNIYNNNSIATVTYAKVSSYTPTGSKLDKDEVFSMCPGAEEYYMNHTDLDIRPVKVTDCANWMSAYDLLFQYNWVYGHCRDLVPFCHVMINVPNGMVVRARLELTRRSNKTSNSGGPSASQLKQEIPDDVWGLQLLDKKKIPRGLQMCAEHCTDLFREILNETPLTYMWSTNQLAILYFNRPPVHTQFEAVKPRLDIRYTSAHAGYVQMLYWDGMGTICDEVIVPQAHVVMISFENFIVKTCAVVVKLKCVQFGHAHQTRHYFYHDDNRVFAIYNTSRLEVCTVTPGRLVDSQPCFKLLFSFQRESRIPQRLNSGLYNCSVDDYWRFQQHLDCNLKTQCQDGRDEAGHCPFSSPACDGSVATHGKCFRQFTVGRVISPERARDQCRELGLELASVKTPQEFRDFNKLYAGREPKPVLIGLTFRFMSTAFMYRHFFSWSDETMIYIVKHIALRVPPNPFKTNRSSILFYETHGSHNSTLMVRIVPPGGTLKQFVCEKPAETEGLVPEHTSAQFFGHHQSSFIFQQRNQAFVTCTDGHVTHRFLSCDPQSHCGGKICFFVNETMKVSNELIAAQHSLETIAMYSCTSGDTEVSYSLLCDFRRDCADNSDESFCHHPTCTEFACSNGQCVPSSGRCNEKCDCLDASDEENCDSKPKISYIWKEHKKNSKQNNSFLINLDGRGYFTQQVMNLTDPCPGTHYRCTKEWFYCLPVYTRCNGVFDCIFHEDERDCATWTCPGLYRCRGSTVCVHAVHMCDGWPQCPQRDDEWLCDMTCPAQCLCQGHAFLCPQPFSAHLFPQLRYLDARGSGMTPSALRNNTYIVRLSLALCSISSLPDMDFANLQIVDLSYNNMMTIVMKALSGLQNIQVLILKGNPLTSVNMSRSTPLHNLKKIDLSETHLDAFDSELFSHIPTIQYLNLSFSKVRSIGPRGFQIMPRLKELDIRGTIINDFRLDLYVGLNDLANVYASNYRLCCIEILPRIVPQPRCVAPRHYLSSCGDMLGSEIYRLVSLFFSTAASLGNFVGFVCHCVKRLLPIPYGGDVIVLMACLQSADFCMGIYSAVITGAHEASRGQYIHFEDRWLDSVACKVAGFLSLLSTEVSVLTMFLLTLDHLVVLCFPHTSFRFSKRSAAAACGVTWLVGILLASLPLLPGLSHWGHYGQTAVCSLMLHDNDHDNHAFLLFHCVLVFNCLICVIVSVFQLIVYRKTPKHRLFIDSYKNPVHSSVDLLMKIAFTHTLRWLSVAISSILALAGVAGQGINVFVTVVMLPLNSAINPLLCLWHAMSYRQRQKQEERLLRALRHKNKCAVTHSEAARKGRNQRPD